MPRPELATGDRLVVKVGTTSLVAPNGEPDEQRLRGLIDAIAAAHAEGIQVILVSSGAIAAGLPPLGFTSRPSDIPSLQAAAAVGQGRLLGLYNSMLAAHGLTGAQTPAHAIRLHAPPAVPERPQHARQVAGARRRPDRQRERHDRGRRDPFRRQRPARRAGREPGSRAGAAPPHRCERACIRPTRARCPMLRSSTRSTASRPSSRRRPAAAAPTSVRAAWHRSSSAAWVATFSGVGVVVADAADPDVLKKVVAGETVGTYFLPHPTAFFGAPAVDRIRAAAQGNGRRRCRGAQGGRRGQAQLARRRRRRGEGQVRVGRHRRRRRAGRGGFREGVGTLRVTRAGGRARSFDRRARRQVKSSTAISWSSWKVVDSGDGQRDLQAGQPRPPRR